MIFNNRGSLLPVAVASMLIIMVAGLACLKLFSSQNMISVVEQAKMRTYYAVEGAIERARAYTDNVDIEETGEPLRYKNLALYTGGTSPFGSETSGSIHVAGNNIYIHTWAAIDGSNMSPAVRISSATISRVTDAAERTSIGIGDRYNDYIEEIPEEESETGDSVLLEGAYKIVATAWTTVENNFARQTITTTLTYYFVASVETTYKEETSGEPPVTKYVLDSTTNEKKIICWRKTVAFTN